jgi:hypothetical protein
MSKIINKKQLDILIESTIKEYDKMEDKTCPECGGMVKEGLCESGCGSNYMEEADIEEGDAFGKAVSDAKKDGKTEFEFQGKNYPVKESDNVEKSVKDLAESVTKTFNPSFLTEDMDNFKKLINYRNK